MIIILNSYFCLKLSQASFLHPISIYIRKTFYQSITSFWSHKENIILYTQVDALQWSLNFQDLKNKKKLHFVGESMFILIWYIPQYFINYTSFVQTAGIYEVLTSQHLLLNILYNILLYVLLFKIFFLFFLRILFYET